MVNFEGGLYFFLTLPDPELISDKEDSSEDNYEVFSSSLTELEVSGYSTDSTSSFYSSIYSKKGFNSLNNFNFLEISNIKALSNSELNFLKYFYALFSFFYL